MWCELMGIFTEYMENLLDAFHTSNDIISSLQFKLQKQNEEDNKHLKHPNKSLLFSLSICVWVEVSVVVYTKESSNNWGSTKI